ncbi:carbohydrate ABC transporter permease [Micromonospora sp. NPDC051300]|uniref:carbohydrate ABC transporter permease n=1 Tax=Micromonospora sp. NPDC051300 TaxID=3364286 RepID=UPI0037A850E7
MNVVPQAVLTEDEIKDVAKPAAPVGQHVAKPRRRWSKWWFLAPAVAFQLVWGWYPLATAVGLSFTSARLRGPVEFTGLDAYQRIWDDPLAWRSLRVTLVYAALTIILTVVLPILFAIFLMEMKPRTMRIMMLLWFLPLSPIAGAVLFRYLYNPEYGLLQYFLTSIGLPEQQFLNSSSQVLIWLALPNLVIYGPGLIYMAALQGIPASYYEAAEVEGAGFWRKIWTISLPRLRPVVVLMLTFGIITSMQEFAWPVLMTGANGEPGGASRTVVMYIFDTIRQLRFADATALSLLLFAVTMALVILLRLVYREDPDAPRSGLVARLRSLGPRKAV